MKIRSIEVLPCYPKSNYVKITTESGLVGWGEPVVEGRARATAQAVEEVAPQLIGKNAGDIEDNFNILYRGNFYKGGAVLNSAISGIEQALWDIKGKHFGVPVYDLLGGAAKAKQKVYAWIHGSTPEAMADSAQRRLAQGYKNIKMNVTNEMEWISGHERIEAASALLGAVRDRVGDKLEIGVDFHGRVHKTVARQLMREIEQYNILFVEEPVLPYNEEDLLDLRRSSSIPIATGERLYTRWDFKKIFRLGAVDIIQPDLSHAGGLWEVRKISAMAEAYDIAVAPHCPLGVIAFAACLHHDLATPNAFIQEQVIDVHTTADGGALGQQPGGSSSGGGNRPPAAVEMYLKENTGVYTFEDGFVLKPQSPGLGIEVDEEKLREDALKTDMPTWSHPVWRMDDGTVTEW
ncbi:MAG: galactonate dehydratase [Oscillospiraceae bacterium]|nr:galactonate dehydratase [Oscillospiraceae bacterium]